MKIFTEDDVTKNIFSYSKKNRFKIDNTSNKCILKQNVNNFVSSRLIKRVL